MKNQCWENLDAHYLESKSFSELCSTKDMKEGVQAFIEKRKNEFQNHKENTFLHWAEKHGDFKKREFNLSLKKRKADFKMKASDVPDFFHSL